MENSENPFARLIRPLNSKHSIRAVIAFALTDDGEAVRYEDGEKEDLHALRRRVAGRKNKAPVEDKHAEDEGSEEGAGNQGEDLAGKVE